MASLRLWIVVLSATWFLTGLAVGALWAPVRRAADVEAGPLEAYESRFLAAFELGPERARLFHELLANYSREIERVKEQHVSEQLVAREPELRRIGQYYDEIIRNKVLPADQRDDFDRLALEVP